MDAARRLIAVHYMQAGQLDAAERTLREQLADHPLDAASLTLLSYVLNDRGRPTEAEHAARYSLELDPDQPQAHLALGYALAARGRDDEARAQAAEVLEMDPESSDARRLLASLHARRKDWQAAIGTLDEGLALEPDDAAMLEQRALYLSRLGRREEAQQAAAGALALNPASSSAHAVRARALLNAGQPEAAVEGYREALRLNPDNDFARAGLVEALKARHRVYGLLLTWFRVSSTWTRGQAILVFVAWQVLARLASVFRTHPESALAGTIVTVLMIVAVWSTYAGRALFDLLLFLDPLGRHALSPRQRLEAMVVGLLMVVAIVGGIGGFAGNDELFVVGLAGLLLVIPVNVAFDVRGPIQRGIPIATGVAMVVLAGLAVTQSLAGRDGSTPMLYMILLGVALSWLATPLRARSRTY